MKYSAVSRATMIGLLVVVLLVWVCTSAGEADEKESPSYAVRLGGDVLTLPVVSGTLAAQGAVRLGSVLFSAAANLPVAHPLRGRVAGDIALCREYLRLGLQAMADRASGEASFAFVASATPSPWSLLSSPFTLLGGIRGQAEVVGSFTSGSIDTHRLTVSPHATAVLAASTSVLASATVGARLTVEASDRTCVSWSPWLEGSVDLGFVEVTSTVELPTERGYPAFVSASIHLLQGRISVGTDMIVPGSTEDLVLTVYARCAFGDQALLGERQRIAEGTVVCTGGTCVVVGP